ncbi:peptidyl-tRNA hydrolase [Candidatus Micrarchaeota archaeon]|nr:MAG: peptidyl-tRNA hydrolase [Candidatus Micrarchaeota archaeon]
MSFKQVIVVRADLKLGKGKLSAHVAHASLEGYKRAKVYDEEAVSEWEKKGQKKIVVKVKDEKELIELYDRARQMGIPCALIHDAGLTQVEPGTLTALVVGPLDEAKVDGLTGHLRLL